MSEFLLAAPLRKRAAVLVEEAEQKVGCTVGHVDDIRHFAPEGVIGLEEARFGGQIDIDRPLDAFVQELGMRRRIEEAVEISPSR